MATILSALPVGSTVSLNVNGTAQEFIILHHGNPDSGLYDASCEGTWLMMKSIHSKLLWGGTSQYAASSIHTWLNETFLPLIDSDIQPLIKTVRIPYAEGSTVHSGGQGLETRLFLTSGYEMGWTAADKPGMPADGACLAYFQDFETADDRRIASLNGSPTWYWTRSPYTQAANSVWVVVSTNGDCTYRDSDVTNGVRPALILPSTMLVDDGGNLRPNTAPSITSPSGTNGASLGIRNTPFLLEYTATDPEGSLLSLSEQLDNQVTRTLTAASGAAQHFAALNDAPAFLQLANGDHTLQVTANDGFASSSLSMTFTKAVTSASLTLTQPLVASDPITVATLTVGGVIPADADFTVEVTNNALDDQPVWQDATAEVREGQNIAFSNASAAKDPAFNFRIRAARGTSGTGGYIDRVTGAFQ